MRKIFLILLGMLIASSQAMAIKNGGGTGDDGSSEDDQSPAKLSEIVPHKDSPTHKSEIHEDLNDPSTLLHHLERDKNFAHFCKIADNLWQPNTNLWRSEDSNIFLTGLAESFYKRSPEEIREDDETITGIDFPPLNSSELEILSQRLTEKEELAHFCQIASRSWKQVTAPKSFLSTLVTSYYKVEVEADPDPLTSCRAFFPIVKDFFEKTWSRLSVIESFNQWTNLFPRLSFLCLSNGKFISYFKLSEENQAHPACQEDDLSEGDRILFNRIKETFDTQWDSIQVFIDAWQAMGRNEFRYVYIPQTDSYSMTCNPGNTEFPNFNQLLAAQPIAEAPIPIEGPEAMPIVEGPILSQNADLQPLERLHRHTVASFSEIHQTRKDVARMFGIPLPDTQKFLDFIKKILAGNVAFKTEGNRKVVVITLGNFEREPVEIMADRYNKWVLERKFPHDFKMRRMLGAIDTFKLKMATGEMEEIIKRSKFLTNLEKQLSEHPTQVNSIQEECLLEEVRHYDIRDLINNTLDIYNRLVQFGLSEKELSEEFLADMISILSKERTDFVEDFKDLSKRYAIMDLIFPNLRDECAGGTAERFWQYFSQMVSWGKIFNTNVAQGWLESKFNLDASLKKSACLFGPLFAWMQEQPNREELLTLTNQEETEENTAQWANLRDQFLSCFLKGNAPVFYSLVNNPEKDQFYVFEEKELTPERMDPNNLIRLKEYTKAALLPTYCNKETYDFWLEQQRRVLISPSDLS